MASTTTTQFIKTRALVLFFLCTLFVPVGISLAASPNLISNGNFETADSINPNFPQYWTNGGFGLNTPVFTYPEIGIGNSKAVKVTINSYSSGDVKWVMTPVSVIPGHAYTYTDSYISNVPTQLIVEYTDASSTVVFGNFTSVSATASSTWGMASATFTVPTGVVSVRVYHTLSSVGSLLLDDASLVEVASLPPTITITPLNLPSVIINTPYSQVITASTTAAGPFVWSILSGALPQGVTLGTSVGATTTISGVPTATSTNAFTVGVSNSTSNASRPYTISVVGSSASVKVITTVVNSYGETNVPSDFTISVNGANASPSFFSGSALGTVVSVTPLSTYVVTTNPGLFYTVSYSPDCRSTISSSDTVTCTITLKDIPPLPAGQSPNLVRNPSLEVADPTAATVPQFWSTGGYGVNDRAFVYPVPGVAAGEGGVSGIAGKVTISSYTNGDAKWIFQNISVIPGHTYVYTDNYLSGQTTSLAVGYTTPTGGISFATFATVPPSQGTSTWSTATIQFTPPAGATSTVVYHSLSSMGSLSLDNVSVSEIQQPISFDQGFVSLTFDDSLLTQYTNALPILDSHNLKGSFYAITHLVEGMSIQNSLLEQPSVASSTIPLGWNKTGSNSAEYLYPAPGFTGNGAQVSSSVSGSNAGWYFTPVTILPDGIYSFTDEYKSTATSTIILHVTQASTTVNAELVDVNGADLFTTTITLPSTGGVWTHVRGYYYVPPAGRAVTVLHRLTGVGSLTIDNMRLGQVGYMTAEELTALQADGQEIGAHTQTHIALAATSIDNATTEILGSKQELLANGNTPLNTIAYPYGSYNQSIQQIVQNNSFIGARSVIPGFNGRNSDKLALLSQTVDAGTTLAQIQSWIDQAKANKQWLILTFHDIESNTTNDPFATTPVILQGTVNYLTASAVPVYTLRQGMAFMGAPKVNVSFTVSNTYGGTATTTDFTALVSGANASLTTFQATASTTVVSLDANSPYSITLQSVPSDYAYATSSGCAGQLAIGSITNCVIAIHDLQVNHAPIAVSSSVYTTANVPVTIPLQAHDIDSNPLSYFIVSPPQHGTLSSSTSSPLYTPSQDFVGSDSFSFKVNDGLLDSTVATVTISVSPATPIATTSGPNIILNPGLTTQDPTNANAPQFWSQGFWGTNAHTFTYPVAGKSGVGATVAITNYTDGDAKWVFKNVSVAATHTYTYSDAYQANILSQLVVEYTFTNGSVGYASGTTISPSSSWGTALVTFTVPVGVTSLRVFHYIAGVGSLTIDDASLTDAAGTSTPPQSGTNLVTNPTFALANGSDPTLPQAWSRGGWGANTKSFSYPVTGKTDATAARVDITAYTDGDAKWVHDSLPVSAGHTYSYSDAYQSTITSTLEIEYTSAGGLLSYASATTVPTSAGVWGSSSLTFTVPTGTIRARVLHYIHSVGSLTLDDVSLVDQAGTPPPTPNLVSNPTFAIADSTNPSLPQSWSQGGWGANTKSFSYPVTGKTDSTAVRIDITAYTDGDAKWLMSNATVTPGVLYTYSDAYQATIGSRLVVEYTSTSNAITYGNFTSLSASPGAWSPASVTFVPPANTVSVRVFHLIEGVGSLTLDDASLSAQ